MTCGKILLMGCYVLVMAGSIGMFVFASWFPFSTRIKDLKDMHKGPWGLNGYYVWMGAWGAILVGTFGQMIYACSH
jgi:hypothetical protein